MPSASKLTVQIFIIIYSYKTCHKNYRNGNNHTLNKQDKLLNSFKEKSKNIEKALWKIIRKFMKNNKLLIKLRRISKRVVRIKEKIDNISNLVKRELFNNLLSQSFKNGSLIHNTGFKIMMNLLKIMDRYLIKSKRSKILKIMKLFKTFELMRDKWLQ